MNFLSFIQGLDEIAGGGVPAERPTLVCGRAGCGKTMLAMEFLVHGATQFGEPGVFMMFEENAAELTANGTNEYPFLIGARGLSVLPLAFATAVRWV